MCKHFSQIIFSQVHHLTFSITDISGCFPWSETGGEMKCKITLNTVAIFSGFEESNTVRIIWDNVSSQRNRIYNKGVVVLDI